MTTASLSVDCSTEDATRHVRVEPLQAGLAVITRDGRRLGTIKEAHERCFLIDVRFAFDYWLSRRAVAVIEQGRVMLGVDKRHIENYLVDPDCVEDDHLAPTAPATLATSLRGAIA